MQWLSGRKTYLVAALMGVLAMARTLGWLDEQSYQTVLGLLAGLGLGTLRAGVTKSGPGG